MPHIIQKLIVLLIAILFFGNPLALAEGFAEERLKCPLGAKQFGDAPPDGNLIFCARVMPGKPQPLRHGPFLSWHKSGELKKSGEYNYGKLEGAQKEYYPNGTLKEKLTYLKDGKLDGEHVSYFQEGNLEVRETFKDGKLEGPREQNYNTGHARSSASYKGGIVDGVFALFHPNGQPRVRGFFYNRERSGTWSTFDDDGAKRTEGGFTEGKPDGTWTRFSRQGNPRSVTKFERGILISKQRYKKVEEEVAEKASSIDERDRKKLAAWNGKVKRSIRTQKRAARSNPEYIPRDEKQRLALERKREHQEERAASKKAAKDREIDAVLDNQKNPFYGVFAVGKRKK